MSDNLLTGSNVFSPALCSLNLVITSNNEYSDFPNIFNLVVNFLFILLNKELPAESFMLLQCINRSNILDLLVIESPIKLILSKSDNEGFSPDSSLALAISAILSNNSLTSFLISFKPLGTP